MGKYLYKLDTKEMLPFSDDLWKKLWDNNERFKIVKLNEKGD